jgi:hypothetical protein
MIANETLDWTAFADKGRAGWATRINGDPAANP